jgi:hypothetical protein
MPTHSRATLLLISLLAGCEPAAIAARGPQEAVHPVREQRLSSATDAPVIDIAFTPGATLPPALAPLATFDESAAIGLFDASEGSEAFVFGSLIDARVDAAGSVLLLDEDHTVVRVLSRSLDSILVVGGSGEGPGEFRRPTSLLLGSPDEFAVLDEGRRQLQSFRRVGGRYEPSERRSVPRLLDLSGGCYVAGSLYVKGLQVMVGNEAVTYAERQTFDRAEWRPVPENIHEQDAAGNVIRSFSVPYTNTLPHIGPLMMHLASSLNAGSMDCNGRLLWIGYIFLGEIHAMNSEGELAWIARIEDYEFPQYIYRWSAAGEPLEGWGRMTFDPEPGNYSIEILTHVSLLTPELLAVGLQRQTVGAVEDDYPQTFTYRTYLLHPETGEFLGAFVADHQVIGGGNGRAVLYRPQPYPQIVVVDLASR